MVIWTLRIQFAFPFEKNVCVCVCVCVFIKAVTETPFERKRNKYL